MHSMITYKINKLFKKKFSNSIQKIVQKVIPKKITLPKVKTVASSIVKKIAKIFIKSFKKTQKIADVIAKKILKNSINSKIAKKTIIHLIKTIKKDPNATLSANKLVQELAIKVFSKIANQTQQNQNKNTKTNNIQKKITGKVATYPSAKTPNKIVEITKPKVSPKIVKDTLVKSKTKDHIGKNRI